MKTANHMFGAVTRNIERSARAEARDAVEQQRRIDEAEARLDAPLTRREVLEAIETLAESFDGAIAEALRNFAEVLS